MTGKRVTFNFRILSSLREREIMMQSQMETLYRMARTQSNSFNVFIYKQLKKPSYLADNEQKTGAGR